MEQSHQCRAEQQPCAAARSVRSKHDEIRIRSTRGLEQLARGFTSRGHGLDVLNGRLSAKRLIDEALQRGEGRR